jgi:hypothetical protein
MNINEKINLNQPINIKEKYEKKKITYDPKIKKDNFNNNHNIKNEDIEFDDKDIFLKDNIDYYDDFLVEDKILDLDIGEGNKNDMNIRPIKSNVKTSFKPRERKISTSNTNLKEPNFLKDVGGHSKNKNEINSRKNEMSKPKKDKDVKESKEVNGKFFINQF